MCFLKEFLSLLVGNQVLFEIHPQIPASAQIWDEIILVENEQSAGDTLVFHLHNHGTNSWRLGGLKGVLEE